MAVSKSPIRTRINLIVTRLKYYGCAFRTAKHETKNRKNKISFILDDDYVVASTYSVQLKNNTRLVLNFYGDYCALREDMDKEVVRVHNYMDDNVERVLEQLAAAYELYFYNLDDLPVLFEKRRDKEKLIEICVAFYPVKLRMYASLDDTAHLYFGAGSLCFKVETDLNQKQLEVITYGMEHNSNVYRNYKYLNLSYLPWVIDSNKVLHKPYFKPYIEAYQSMKQKIKKATR